MEILKGIVKKLETSPVYALENTMVCAYSKSQSTLVCKHFLLGWHVIFDEFILMFKRAAFVLHDGCGSDRATRNLLLSVFTDGRFPRCRLDDNRSWTDQRHQRRLYKTFFFFFFRNTEHQYSCCVLWVLF